jgi:hypothetical protein
VVTRKAVSPTSLPVVLPVSNNGWVGTAAQELPTYRPSASLEMVTVLGTPWSERLQRTATRPNAASTRKPLSSRAPLPHSVSVKLS